MNQVEINIKKMDSSIKDPSYARSGDAGADLASDEAVFTLKKGEIKAVATGIYMAIPEGFVGLIHPRSGLALNSGITVLNSPGTIDSGYRGEIKVILINHGEDKVIFKGDKIAQLIIQKVEQAKFVEVAELDVTDRNEGGFGSTGA
jgi:dUTP pyrophosphatase